MFGACSLLEASEFIDEFVNSNRNHPPPIGLDPEIVGDEYATEPGCLSRDRDKGESLLVGNVTVIDGTSEKPRHGMSILIENGKIAAVLTKNSLGKLTNIRTINGDGRYLIPALWDMHTHITHKSISDVPEVTLGLLVAYGVLGVRDMGGDWTLLQRWRQMIADGEMAGPQIVATGLMLDGKEHFPSTLVVTTPARARAAVRDLAYSGVDFVKVQSLLEKDVFVAIADEAKKTGLPLVGHVPFSVDIVEAIESGMEDINHLTGLAFRDQMSLMNGTQTYRNVDSDVLLTLRANQIWQTPTLIWVPRVYLEGPEILDFTDEIYSYIPTATIESWRKSYAKLTQGRPENSALEHAKIISHFNTVIKDLNTTGIKFLAGTDLGAPFIMPGKSLHKELQFLVQAGLSPMDAIKSATLYPAKLLGFFDDIGSVEVGKTANLILLEKNPLDNIKNTESIIGVFYQGCYMPRQNILSLLTKTKSTASSMR